MTAIMKTSRLLFLTCNKNISSKYNSVRFAGFFNSPFLEDVEIKAKYDVTKSLEDWKYVERILPPVTVPPLTAKDTYHSGFKPQAEDLRDQEYYVSRTRNHMLPVYLKIFGRGERRLTYVRKIQGDIWLLGKELESFLQPMSKTPLRMQVNEFAGLIVINGDYVNAIKYWLQERNY